jgi:hypothetical protein
VIGQLWAVVVTSASYAVNHPVILFGGLALTASVISSLIVSEVKNK